MKYVRIQIGDKKLTVDAAGFARVRDEHPKTDLHPTCIECGNRAFLNNEKGAKGIRLVSEELTSRGKVRKLVGFSHYAGNKDKDCQLYLANDPRFADLHQRNDFDVLEKERNLAALARPGTPSARQAIAEVQKFFMRILTGSSEVSPEEQAQMEKLEKKFMAMKGLADHLWILGFAVPLVAGSREKPMGKQRRMVRVEFKGVGEQKLPFTDLGGRQRSLRIPKFIDLCFSRHDGKEPQPLRKGGVDPIRFEVSRDFAAKIVRDAYPLPQKPLPVAEQLAQYEQQGKPFQRPKKRAKPRPKPAGEPPRFL